MLFCHSLHTYKPMSSPGSCSNCHSPLLQIWEFLLLFTPTQSLIIFWSHLSRWIQLFSRYTCWMVMSGLDLEGKQDSGATVGVKLSSNRWIQQGKCRTGWGPQGLARVRIRPGWMEALSGVRVLPSTEVTGMSISNKWILPTWVSSELSWGLLLLCTAVKRWLLIGWLSAGWVAIQERINRYLHILMKTSIFFWITAFQIQWILKTIQPINLLACLLVFHSTSLDRYHLLLLECTGEWWGCLKCNHST